MNARPPALPRVLGLFDVAVLSSASMGPAYSLATTMGPMVATAGTLAPLALVLIAAIILCVALSFADLAALVPSAGSSFTWVSRAFGPSAGAYAAWLLLLSNYFATMTTALPAASYTLDLLAPSLSASPLWTGIVATLWILGSTLLLYVGLRPTALTTTLFLLIEFVVVGASAVVASVVRIAPERLAASATLPVPWIGVAIAMVLGIWMIDGWEVSASATEEATGSGATSGRGGVVGLILATVLLLGAMLAYLHVGSVAGFAAHQSDAMTYVAERLGGPVWKLSIVTAVLLSTGAALWTTTLYLSRSAYAMGRDGALPRALGKLDARGLPSNALFAISGGVAVCTLLTSAWPTVASAFALVLNGTSVFLGLLFCMSVLSALRLGGEASHDRTLRVKAVPLAGAVGLAVVLIVDVAASDATTRAIEIGGLVLGLPFAWWRGRRGARTALADQATS